MEEGGKLEGTCAIPSLPLQPLDEARVLARSVPIDTSVIFQPYISGTFPHKVGTSSYSSHRIFITNQNIVLAELPLASANYSRSLLRSWTVACASLAVKVSLATFWSTEWHIAQCVKTSFPQHSLARTLAMITAGKYRSLK